MAAKKPPRGILGDALAEGITKERIDKLLDDAFGATSTQIVTCPKCGTGMKLPVPDVKKAADTVLALIQEHEGRPEQRRSEATKITVIRPPLD